MIDAKNIDDQIIRDLNSIDCLIIDSFNNNIDEKLFYSLLNQSKQLDNFILVNSLKSIKNEKFF